MRKAEGETDEVEKGLAFGSRARSREMRGRKRKAEGGALRMWSVGPRGGREQPETCG